MQEQIKIIKGYALYGALTGLVVTILAVILTNLGPGNGYGAMHSSNPSLYLIDTLPILLAGVFYLVGSWRVPTFDFLKQDLSRLRSNAVAIGFVF